MLDRLTNLLDARTWTLLSLVCSSILGLVSLARTQPPPKVEWTAKLEPAEVRAGESSQIVVTGRILDGWKIYAFRNGQPEGPVWTTLTLAPNPAVVENGPAVQPSPHRKFDRGFKFDVEYFEKAVAFGIPVKISEGAKGKIQLVVEVRSQACDATSCDPPKTSKVSVSLEVEDGLARPGSSSPITKVPPQPPGYVPPDTNPKDAPPPTGSVVDDQAEAIERAQSGGLIPYLWLSFTAGLLALLTPCVWPMVPITVSFFSKKTEGQRKSNLKGAFAYCIGIMGTFAGLGVVMTLLFGSTGIQKLAASPWVNLFLAALFIVLALNLFGVFEIIVPSSVVTKAQKGSGKDGLVGPILMGLTFSLTTFTCTVPFVGTLLVAATKGNWLFPILGMLAFSLAFAVPFFLLALFPQYLSNLPKSGGWLTAVKVTMGFLELAAALKFLSSADLVWEVGFLTKPVFLAIWMAIFATSGLYLLGWLSLGHKQDQSPIGWTRRLFGVGMIGVSVYWLMAINGTSMGPIAGFVPPETYPGRSTAGGAIVWSRTFADGQQKARQDGKSMFVNFTGVTCTNCRYMEQDVFPQPEITAAINAFVPVELYTDRGTPEDDANAELREKLTNTATNPVYAVVAPDGKVLKIFQGSSVTDQQFIDFLKEAKRAADEWKRLSAQSLLGGS